MSIADLPLFSVHSEPKPRRKHRRTGGQRSGPTTYRTKRPSYCSALRALLADGEWRSLREIMDVGGTRAPGRMHDIARGLDGGEPRQYEVAHHPEDHTLTFYRLCVGERPPVPREAVGP